MKNKEYSVVIIDPPWQYKDKMYTEKILKYNTMNENEIINFIQKYKNNIQEDAHIYFWTTNSFIEQAIGIINKLQFQFKQVLVWKKLTVKNNRFFGLGRFYRNEHELCLFCTNGKNRNLINKGIRTIFEDISLPQSQKPKQTELFWIENSYKLGTKVLYLFSGKEKINTNIKIDYVDEVLNEPRRT